MKTILTTQESLEKNSSFLYHYDIGDIWQRHLQGDILLGDLLYAMANRLSELPPYKETSVEFEQRLRLWQALWRDLADNLFSVSHDSEYRTKALKKFKISFIDFRAWADEILVFDIPPMRRCWVNVVASKFGSVPNFRRQLKQKKTKRTEAF